MKAVGEIFQVYVTRIRLLWPPKHPGVWLSLDLPREVPPTLSLTLAAIQGPLIRLHLVTGPIPRAEMMRHMTHGWAFLLRLYGVW
jgi:hypothetical protein